jgi:ribulose kinase
LAGRPGELEQNPCLVAGTSNSIVALAAEARPLHGVWGPYREAILPGTWLLEAGQSASGAVFEHLLRWHRAGGEPTPERHQAIADRIAELRLAEGPAFAADLHVLPDFHGNRSPLADASAFGVISGLTLEADFDSLCRLYWRTAVAIGLGVRQNLEALGTLGFSTETLLLAGGHARNELLVGLYADATGAVIVEPNAADAVLLGGAMLAATAAGIYPSLAASAAAMEQAGTVRRPDASMKPYYDRDYRVMLEMQQQRRALAGVK